MKQSNLRCPRQIVFGALILSAWAAASPASAQLSRAGTGNCRVGLAVVARDGRTGTVESAEGNSCWVRMADGTKDYFLQWMLKPAGAQRSGSAGAARSGMAPNGNYQCYGGAAGNMRITISNGRWNGFYTALLPDGKVGISSKPNGRPYYMVCERR